MKKVNDLIADCLDHIEEIFPWDLEEKMDAGETPLIVDIREPAEFEFGHIKNSLHIPRGVLETACEYDYDETEPQLASGRQSEVVLVCRSGNRSALAAFTLQLMGFEKVTSLKTGLRGWNDYELPLVNQNGEEVDIDDADEFFTTQLRDDQKSPQ